MDAAVKFEMVSPEDKRVAQQVVQTTCIIHQLYWSWDLIADRL